MTTPIASHPINLNPIESNIESMNESMNESMTQNNTNQLEEEWENLSQPHPSHQDLQTHDAGSHQIVQNYTVNSEQIGERIDKIAALVFSDYSREQIKNWLESGELTVNGAAQKPKYRLKPNDVLILKASLTAQQQDLPENIPLDILYEDEAVLVINKPVGLVVHPGAGNGSGTLVNALLFHYPDSRTLPRAGLVHRIDKETSGLMVIAKDSQSQLHLINQLKDKSVYRLYQAIVLASAAELARHRTIDAPIGRHPTQRTKMAVVGSGKPAVTHLEKITAISDAVLLVSVRLETGRTHQIRVHLSNLGFPLLGDPLYGAARKNAILLKTLDDDQKQIVQQFQRQALHAYELGFIHPKTGEPIKVQARLPEDMQQLLDTLKP